MASPLLSEVAAHGVARPCLAKIGELRPIVAAGLGLACAARERSSQSRSFGSTNQSVVDSAVPRKSAARDRRAVIGDLGALFVSEPVRELRFFAVELSAQAHRRR